MKRRAFAYKKRIMALLLACLLFVVCAFPAAASEAPASGADDSATSQLPEDGSAAAGQEAEEDYFVPDYAVQAEAVCLVNEDTGLVVYQKNADEPLASASLVKMMTCILTVERFDDLDAETVTSDKTWIYDELYGKNASTADIRKGETLTVRELLYAALLPSANEAALLLADHVAGSYMKNFLYMMNTRAKSLGCTGTYFADPNGLSEDNVTTAHDMVLITRAFMGYPELVEIAATASYEMAAHEEHAAPYYITTTNRLLVTTSPYHSAFPNTAGCVVAGKTGSLGEWQNFASMAVKNGETYICAVLHSPNAADPIGPELDPAQARPALYEAAALYDWAFSTLGVRPALDTTQPVTEIRVRYSSEQDMVRLMPAGDLKTVLPQDADDMMIKRVYDLPEYLSAPIQKGDVVGSITLTLAGQEVGTTELLAERDVARNDVLYAAGKVGDFFSSLFIRIVLVLVVLLVGGYVAMVYFSHKKREKRKQAAHAAAKQQRINPNETSGRDTTTTANSRPQPYRVQNAQQNSHRHSAGDERRQ